MSICPYCKEDIIDVTLRIHTRWFCEKNPIAMLKKAFTFWNNCLINRTVTYQRRKIPRKERLPKNIILCGWCGENEAFMYDYIEKTITYPKETIKQGAICRSCRSKLEVQQLDGARIEIKAKSIELISAFDDLLDDCTKKGTCDILTAHHNVLKDDPERLSTKTLIGLVCNSSTDNSYEDKWTEILKQQKINEKQWRQRPN